MSDPPNTGDSAEIHNAPLGEDRPCEKTPSESEVAEMVEYMKKIPRETLFNYLVWVLGPHVPFWTALNRMGRSRVLQTSYFWLFAVPILAQLLIKVGPEIDIPFWSSAIPITLKLPFSWKMFFYAAVSFSAL